MTSDYLNAELIMNQERHRFEMNVESDVAIIEFMLNNENILFLTHTEVPKALEGKGVGFAIVDKVFHYIKDHNYTLAPICPFVAKYLLRHQDWKSILAKGYYI
jgi:predicted GNAT family acetyltransferase